MGYDQWQASKILCWPMGRLGFISNAAPPPTHSAGSWDLTNDRQSQILCWPMGRLGFISIAAPQPTHSAGSWASERRCTSGRFTNTITNIPYIHEHEYESISLKSFTWHATLRTSRNWPCNTMTTYLGWHATQWRPPFADMQHNDNLPLLTCNTMTTSLFWHATQWRPPFSDTQYNDDILCWLATQWRPPFLKFLDLQVATQWQPPFPHMLRKWRQLDAWLAILSSFFLLSLCCCHLWGTGLS